MLGAYQPTTNQQGNLMAGGEMEFDINTVSAYVVRLDEESNQILKAFAKHNLKPEVCPCLL